MSHSLERLPRPESDGPRVPDRRLARRETPAAAAARRWRPSAAATNPLLPAEMRTLALLCDALLPGEADSPWRQGVPDRVARLVARLPSRDDVARLRLLLTLLELPFASLALGGPFRGVGGLDRAARERLLRCMAGHPLGQVRTGFLALKRLAGMVYYGDAPERGPNPVWSAIGYPGPLASGPDVPSVVRTYYVSTDTTLECEVVVVGSGAGGGVVAGALATAGLDVVVVEKGGHFGEADFRQREQWAYETLYQDGGLSASADLGVHLLAGSCLGGGTVVNYTTSLRLPDDVRAEWARVSGLPFFESAAFTRTLDAASETLGVNEAHSAPSARDALLERGLRDLGWHVAAMPRNVRGCTQDDVCGYCGFGCVRGARQSTLETALRAASERGARIVVDCGVEVVLREHGRAVGVVGRTREGHVVTVRASKAVVLAAGAIHTPAVLLRSGLDDGPVGRNLRLHPVTGVWGRFAEPVQPWTGTLQARYSEQFARLQDGYGVRFETAPVHPGFAALAAPWDGAPRLEAWMRTLPYLSPVGVLTRDRGGGSVGLDRAGSPVVRYRISRQDQRHVRIGLEGAARVLETAGAEEIFSSQTRGVSYRPGHGQREGWLRRVEAAGFGPTRMPYVSFHQMGTCAMGARRGASVVDGEGESHTLKRLFVADGSLFPTASGVNPMLTIAALAHHVARCIAARG